MLLGRQAFSGAEPTLPNVPGQPAGDLVGQTHGATYRPIKGLGEAAIVHIAEFSFAARLPLTGDSRARLELHISGCRTTERPSGRRKSKPRPTGRKVGA